MPPFTTLEIADCSRRIELEFEIDSEEARENALHKLDTLVSALRLFREGSSPSSNRTTCVNASGSR